jgi:hypothetical protein
LPNASKNSILSDPIRWDEPQVGVPRSKAVMAFLTVETTHQKDCSELSSALPIQARIKNLSCHPITTAIMVGDGNFVSASRSVRTLAAVGLATWDYSRMDFFLEAATNCKAIYINSWFWAQHDFANDGLNAEEKRKTIEALRRAWEFNEIKIPLPPHLLMEGKSDQGLEKVE